MVALVIGANGHARRRIRLNVDPEPTACADHRSARIEPHLDPDDLATFKMLLANLYAASGSVMRVAKGDRRVCATGMSASHAAVRTKLRAVAIKRWSKRVFARPM